MNRPGRGTVYSVTMILVVGGLVLIGALALSLMNSSASSGPAFPVTVFGDPRTGDRVIALPAIRPEERAVLPQGSMTEAQLLPLPAKPVWKEYEPTTAGDSLYVRAAEAGLKTQLDRARQAAQDGTRERALFLYDALTRRMPDDRALVLEHASVLASFGEHRRAADLLRAELARRPDDEEVRMLAARNAWWSEQPLLADSLLSGVLAVRPADAEALRLRETIRTTTQPPLPVARAWAATGAAREQLLLARALVREGSYAPALAPYRLALADPRLHTDSLLLEAASAAAAADSVEALEGLTREYLVLHPDDASATLRVARAYSWRGDYASAMRNYEQLDWSDPSIRLEVAQVLIWSKREREAEGELKTVLVARPHDATALKLLGDLSLWRGDYAQAQTYYGAAFQADPSVQGLAAGQLAAAAGLEQARLASMPRPAPVGAVATFEGFGDNQGFRWLAARAGRSFRAGGAMLNASVAQLAYEGSPTGVLSRNTGAGLQVDGSYDLRPGLRLTALAGGESYGSVNGFAIFGAGLTVFDLHGVQAGIDYRHQPAVSRAATLAALQARATSDVLAVSFSATRGAWSAAARAEGERFASEVGGANRVAGAASVTRTLTPQLAATIGLSALRVDRPSPVLAGFGNVLWAPSAYVEPTVGLAWRAAVSPRFTASAGWQMGVGFANERAGDQRFGTGAIPTGTLSGDLLYRSGPWAVGVGGSYGGALVRGYRAGTVRIQGSYRLGQ